MKYIDFKNEIKLSNLGMGNMRLPQLGDDPRAIDYAKGQEIIDYCMSQGINYYDTAYIYHDGQSEVFLSKALAKYPRESYYLADKFKLSANPDYQAQFQEQLERLNVEYIDFYLLHGIADNNIDSYLNSGCIEYFKQLKKEGKIKYLGFSFHGNPAVLERMITIEKWDFVQIQLNYYDWYYGTAKEQYDLLTNQNIAIMVMEPVHGGMLANLSDEAKTVFDNLNTDKSSASWALRFVADLNNIAVILSGMSNLDQVIDNIQTFNQSVELSANEQKAIKEACTIIHQQLGVPCTACRYCVSHCPKKLDIPYLLKVYNEYKTGGKWRLSRFKGEQADKLPSNCVVCGMCTKQCPQGIEVSKFLKEMAYDFETM